MIRKIGLGDGVHAMYLNGMMRAMVYSLVGIFTPIYIYQLVMNRGGSGTFGVIAVALFYLLIRVTVLVFALPVSHMIERVGFRRSILVSAVFLGLYLFFLRLARFDIWYLVIAAVAGGINTPSYWIARGSVISQDGSRGQVGKQIGNLLSVEELSAILGPVAAGLVIEKWGFSYLYFLALIVLLASVIPMWYMPRHTHKNGASWRGFGIWIKNRRYFHQAVGIAGKSVIDYASAVVWPLAIFVMGWHTSLLGGLFSLVAIIGVCGRLVYGRLFDTLHKRGDMADEKLFASVSFGVSMLHLARIFAMSVKTIFALDLFGAIFATLHSSMYSSYEQLGGMRMGSIAYWVYKEIVYSVMVVVMMGVLAVAAWFSVWKELFLLMASMWVIIGMVQARESNLT